MRGPNDLVGMQVSVSVSDPWELAAEDQTLAPDGTIEAVESHEDGADREAILVALSPRIIWRDVSYGYVLATTRRGSGFADELLSGVDVECEVIALTDSPSTSINEAIDSWRGGLALRATVGRRVP